MISTTIALFQNQTTYASPAFAAIHIALASRPNDLVKTAQQAIVAADLNTRTGGACTYGSPRAGIKSRSCDGSVSVEEEKGVGWETHCEVRN